VPPFVICLPVAAAVEKVALAEIHAVVTQDVVRDEYEKTRWESFGDAHQEVVVARKTHAQRLVLSLSSNRGGSHPQSRPGILGDVAAIWICRVSGSISGARRAPSSTAASNSRPTMGRSLLERSA
jgi:hypothetical protein